MARKDIEKDSDRPHYYSQFWLDVAAGRRIIGAPKPEEEGEQAETEIPETPRRTGRTSSFEQDEYSPASVDGRRETIEHPVVEPLEEPEVAYEPEVDEFAEEEDLEQNPELEDEDIPDMDLGLADDEEEEEVFDEEEEEEEEEDDLGWGGRGRKKPKPGRTTKPQARPKGKRDTRRGF